MSAGRPDLVTTSVKLDPIAREALRIEARRQGSTVGGLLRQAAVELLRRLEQEREEREEAGSAA